MRSGTPPVRSLTRALALLDIAVRDNGTSSTLQLSEQLNLAPATAHRLMTALVDSRFLTSVDRGRHVAGPALRGLAPLLGEADWLCSVARPILRRLSRDVNVTAHLGVLQGSMVTYLVKESSPGDRLFTREGTQLEAYCSAIGKVLLANLPHSECEAYLQSGPFVALTAATITRADVLRSHLEGVKASGYAVDDREIASDLRCVAVPILWPDSSVRAAISLSVQGHDSVEANTPRSMAKLKRASLIIGERLRANAIGSELGVW
jgi:IclR family acetate operon transcriptional repressor